jgi:hypothetical protein
MHKPKSRDCDYVLYAFLLIEYRVPIDTLSAKDFLKQLSEKQLPSFEGVSRCRRKLQERHKELRGRKWAYRQKSTKDVKSEIKQM